MSTNTKLKILTLIGLLLIATGFKCKCIRGQVKEALKPITLTYWRVWDGPDTFSEIISAYKAMHPNVSVSYRKLRYEELEKELLEAFAQNRAPDIISLHSSWLPKYLNKGFIVPMPSQVTMAYQTVKKSMGLKEEAIIELKSSPTPTLGKIKNDYLDVISKNIVINNKVYGLPLSVDTLVMYYNRDLLNNAGLALPPENWQEFQEAVKKMTFQDHEGNIVQAGAALGTAKNINRSPDILALLMMQNGALMMAGNQVSFNQIPATQPDKTYNPGLEALKFYTDFANPSKEVYSWNNQLPDSLTAFAAGQVGFYFGYSYDLPRILAGSKGKINLGLAKMPQIAGSREINFANFWVETVSSRSQHQNEAWDFILFAANEKVVKSYLNRAKKPTALRALVTSQLQDDQLNIFASQLLTATNWYLGNDANAAEEIIKQMIEQVVAGNDPSQALNLAAERVQQTVR